MIVAIELSLCCRGQLQNLEPTNRLFYVCSRRLLSYLSCLAISCPAISCLAILMIRHFHACRYQRPIFLWFTLSILHADGWAFSLRLNLPESNN